MGEIWTPRLEVPEITEEALEKSARLFDWLKSLATPPAGVRITTGNNVEFGVYYDGESPGQCAAIIPGPALLVRRITITRTEAGKTAWEETDLPPTINPVLVKNFDFGDNFLEELDSSGHVPIVAESPHWVPEEHQATWDVQVFERYPYDPTAHRLAIFDGWEHPFGF